MDWHQYAPDQVETWADRIWRRPTPTGSSEVEFVHGAADVVARGTPGWREGGVAGRGRIKEILRKRLYSGRWRRWAEQVRSGRHGIEEGRMVIALLENPRPESAGALARCAPPRARLRVLSEMPMCAEAPKIEPGKDAGRSHTKPVCGRLRTLHGEDLQAPQSQGDSLSRIAQVA